MKTNLIAIVMIFLLTQLLHAQNDPSSDRWKENTNKDTYVLDGERILIGSDVAPNVGPATQLVIDKNLLVGANRGVATPHSSHNDGNGVIIGDAGYMMDRNNGNLNLISRGSLKVDVKAWDTPIEAFRINQQGQMGLNQSLPLGMLHVKEKDFTGSGLVLEAIPGGNPNVMFAVDNDLKTNLRYNDNLGGMQIHTYVGSPYGEITSIFAKDNQQVAIAGSTVHNDEKFKLNVHGHTNTRGLMVNKGLTGNVTGAHDDVSTLAHTYLRSFHDQDTMNVVLNTNALLIGIDHICKHYSPPAIPSTVGLYLDAGSEGMQHGTGLWTVYSDQRLKQNVQPLENSLEVLKKVNIYSFEYNGKAGTKRGDMHYGVIADEMQKILPNTVSTGTGKLNPEDKLETEILAFNANDLLMVNVDATKRLALEVEAKEERILALESQVAQLQSDMNELISAMQRGKQPQKASPEGSQLYQSLPNPTKGAMSIGYRLPEDCRSAFIIVSDLQGKTIEQIKIDGEGEGNLTFNAKRAGLSAGTYIYSLLVNQELVDSKKFVLLD